MNFLKKIFSTTFLVISIFLLIYTYYKSEIYWYGSSDSYLIYYIFSSSLIIFSIITFFINDKIKEYLIISLISVVFVLYLFEGYLIFKGGFVKLPSKKMENILKKTQLYKKKTEKIYDTRARLKIFEDLKKINNKITLTVSPFNYINDDYEFFPLSSASNSKTIYCNENGYYSIYQSDRYGFNNPDNEWEKNQIEYLLIGDSFVHGACVNKPNDIASILRNLSNKSVLNLGYSANGPLVQYATLIEYLDPKVKKVLWFYYEENDFKDLNNELSNRILKNYLDDLKFTQNLKTNQNKINDLVKEKIKKQIEIKNRELKKNKLQNNKTRYIKFIKISNIRSLILPKLKKKNQLKQQVPPEFKKILKLTKELIIKNNSKLYFVYLPEYNRYKVNYDNTNYLLVKKIVNELDIPFIDIHTQVFDKEKNPLKLFPFELYGHYNVEGYQKVAETIHEFIRN
jgi:hypothetical protein